MPKKKTTRRRRVLSGLGAAKKRRRKKSTAKGKWKRVSRKAATHQSGKKKGRLKPGCKFIKGDGAMCRSGSSSTKKRSTKKRRTSKKKTAKKKAGHVYSGNPKRSAAFKKGKSGKMVLKKGCRKITSGANKGKVRCKRKMTSRRKAA